MQNRGLDWKPGLSTIEEANEDERNTTWKRLTPPTRRAHGFFSGPITPVQQVDSRITAIAALEKMGQYFLGELKNEFMTSVFVKAQEIVRTAFSLKVCETLTIDEKNKFIDIAKDQLHHCVGFIKDSYLAQKNHSVVTGRKR